MGRQLTQTQMALCWQNIKTHEWGSSSVVDRMQSMHRSVQAGQLAASTQPMAHSTPAAACPSPQQIPQCCSSRVNRITTPSDRLRLQRHRQQHTQFSRLNRLQHPICSSQGGSGPAAGGGDSKGKKQGGGNSKGGIGEDPAINKQIFVAGQGLTYSSPLCTQVGRSETFRARDPASVEMSGRFTFFSCWCLAFISCDQVLSSNLKRTVSNKCCCECFVLIRSALFVVVH